jgi:LmbE family N-acetylglucosaminyl deacetylase
MIVPIVEEAEWAEHLEKLTVWATPQLPTLVIAPHPDDETLGAGGLIAALRQRGVAVNVVAVTDGESAYGNDASLGLLRREEQENALQLLGVERKAISRFCLPDSNVSEYEEALIELITPLASKNRHVLAPWVGDFHPDHEACGRAARRVTNQTGAKLTYYLFWTWHRGTPRLLDDVNLVRFPLDEKTRITKAAALQCHRSQLHNSSGGPILTAELLGPVWRPYEVFVTT